METPKTLKGLISKLSSVKKYTTAAGIAKEFVRQNEGYELLYKSNGVFGGNDAVSIKKDGITVYENTDDKGICWYGR